jgi:glycosyltransferase involved in cell wall biosynthesis
VPRARARIGAISGTFTQQASINMSSILHAESAAVPLATERQHDVDVPAIELTIVMPCLNEAETLAACINKARGYLSRSGVRGEVVIADNGSTDGSQRIASSLGARVVDVPVRGYGAALAAGIEAARGRFIVMGDSDDSYDFSRLDAFVAKLREGAQLVMGNRFKGGIAPGAMPPLHRYLGNPVLSTIGRMFFPSSIGDFHCGLRGFDKAAIQGLNLRTTGMEFASEMVIKAALTKLRISEVPTTLSPDGRSRPPHLRSWRDGWRHLRLLLMFAPRSLFLYPGLAMVALGLLSYALVLPGPLRMGSVVFDVHTLVIGMAAILVGMQVLCFFLLAKQHAIGVGVLPTGDNFNAFRRRFRLELALLLAGALVLGGIGGIITAVIDWGAQSFGVLDYSRMMRLVVPSVTALAVGVQIAMAGFLSSILDLKTSKS